MSSPVEAWGLAFALTGGAWTLVMLVGLIATPRDFLQARFLMGTFTFLGLALTAVGMVGLV